RSADGLRARVRNREEQVIAVVLGVIVAVVVLAGILAAILTQRRRREPLRDPSIEARPADAARNVGARAAEEAADRVAAETAIPASPGLAGRIRSLFVRGVTDDTWRELEEALIRSDVGAKAASAIVGRVRRSYRPPADPADVVAAEIVAGFE